MTTTFSIAAKRLVTSHEGLGAGPLGVIEDAALVVEDGRIAWLGRQEDLPRGVAPPKKSAPLVTAGLVDAHTHAAWVGSRHDEYAIRMAGGDYEEIAKAGGGIASSHRAVVAAREDEIAATLAERLERMARLGVTTTEVKSGYGLLPEEEKKQLRAIRRVASRRDLPSVVATYLGLHSVPPSMKGDRAAFIAGSIALLDEIAREKLAAFVDAYVDRNAFSCDEARPFLERGKELGLGVRLHAGQFADVGGAELAASVGALSADHLEVIEERGARALASASVFAGLLPTACFTLRQSPPPISLLRSSGVRFVVASDANPGTAPTESLPLAMALAVRLFGLTTEETLLGVTRYAAESLGRGHDGGSLAIGKAADMVLWDLPHEHALVQPWGVSRAASVLREGTLIAGEAI